MSTSSYSDLSFLTQETLSICGEFQKVSEAFRRSAHRDRRLMAPGILFYLDRGEFTFSIRTCVVATETTLEEISRDERVLKQLKIGPDKIDEIDYYSCAELSHAEIIGDFLSNRRYPFNEERIFNLSDPGVSWWMSGRSEEIVVHFRSYGVDRAKELINLGPMGDHSIAMARFSKMGPLFASAFSLKEFSIDEKTMIIRPVDVKNEMFIQLRNLLLCGTPLDGNRFGMNISHRLYLGEMAAIRSFWLTLDSKLKRNLTQ